MEFYIRSWLYTFHVTLVKNHRKDGHKVIRHSSENVLIT
jgi:hypothetical protein